MNWLLSGFLDWLSDRLTPRFLLLLAASFRRLGFTTHKIFRKFDVKFDILILEIVISGHAELEVLVDIEVDIILILLKWNLFKIHPRSVGSLCCFLDWLSRLFLFFFL